MLGNTTEGYEAFEELAVYYEHRAHQPQNALEIVRKALDELRLANRLGTIGPSLYREIKAQFDGRLERLERKGGQSLVDGAEPHSQPSLF